MNKNARPMTLVLLKAPISSKTTDTDKERLIKHIKDAQLHINIKAILIDKILIHIKIMDTVEILMIRLKKNQLFTR